MLDNTKELLLPLTLSFSPPLATLSHLISPEGPETMRNLLKLISNSFQKKWATRRPFKWPPRERDGAAAMHAILERDP